MVIELDLVKLLKWELNINEYLTILKIKYLNDKVPCDIPFVSSEDTIKSLIDKNFIKDHDGSILLTKKAGEILGLDDIDFDDVFFLYPYKTPNGRPLRSKSKSIMGSPTRDYKILEAKYKSKVNNKDKHKAIVTGIKRAIDDYKRRDALNFLPKLETFINQSGWERFLEDVNNIEEFENDKGNSVNYDGRNIERL